MKVKNVFATLDGKKHIIIDFYLFGGSLFPMWGVFATLWEFFFRFGEFLPLCGSFCRFGEFLPVFAAFGGKN